MVRSVNRSSRILAPYGAIPASKWGEFPDRGWISHVSFLVYPQTLFPVRQFDHYITTQKTLRRVALMAKFQVETDCRQPAPNCIVVNVIPHHRLPAALLDPPWAGARYQLPKTEEYRLHGRTMKVSARGVDDLKFAQSRYACCFVMLQSRRHGHSDGRGYTSNGVIVGKFQTSAWFRDSMCPLRDVTRSHTVHGRRRASS